MSKTPQPGTFWFADPPIGDLTIVEVISREHSGAFNILPLGSDLQQSIGWTFLAEILIPPDIRKR